MLRAARRLVRFRSLLATLTARELKARYRGSALGYVWSLVNPLLLLAVYTFVFGYVFHPRDARADPYALFLTTGLFPWIWFQASVMEGTGSFLANAGLIRKATFPVELLPVVPVLSNLVHFALALPVLAAAFVVFRLGGHQVGGWSALVLPAVVLVQLPMVSGLSIGLAALNAHFKDVKDIVNNVLTVLFFVTPILYTVEMVSSVPWVQRLVRLGPVAPYTVAYQEVLFYGTVPGPLLWVQMAAVSVGAWMVGTWLFERLAETLVEAV